MAITIQQVDQRGRPVLREDGQPDGRQLRDRKGNPVNRWRVVREGTLELYSDETYPTRNEAKQAAQDANAEGGS
jgi:hypothetical protein